MGAHSRPLASHTRADTQPGLKFLSAQELVSSPPMRSFKSWLSSVADEPIDADAPHVVQHLAVVLSVQLFFLVTAIAFLGAGLLLFKS